MGLTGNQAEELINDVIDVIPCRMPYSAAHLQPRKKGDRAPLMPHGSRNFAMIGQMVELTGEVSSTEEHAVRTAREAVYRLMDVTRPVYPVTPCTQIQYARLLWWLIRN